jgi:hypothetical protein
LSIQTGEYIPIAVPDSRLLIGLSSAPRLGRDRGDDVVFTETDGHSALLAAHDGPEDSDASAFWIPERFTGVIGQEQFEPDFRAFRQGDIRMKVGPSGADVCRPESMFSFFRCSRQGLAFHRDREIVALVFPSLNHQGSLSMSCMDAVYRVGGEKQAGKKYDFD